MLTASKSRQQSPKTLLHSLPTLLLSTRDIWNSCSLPSRPLVIGKLAARRQASWRLKSYIEHCHGKIDALSDFSHDSTSQL